MSTMGSFDTTLLAPLYADPSGTMGGGTPLIVAVSKAGREDYQVLVRLQVLQAYDQMIFELQQQLLRYKMLLDQLTARKSPFADELRLEAKPMTPASARIVDSIVRAKPSRKIRRGYEELDD